MADTNYFNGNNQEENRKGTSRRGFASMDHEKQREIASKGGKASAAGDTSNRGFASMDGDKQRRIASEGGKASGLARRNNALRSRMSSSTNERWMDDGVGSRDNTGQARNENSGRATGE